MRERSLQRGGFLAGSGRKTIQSSWTTSWRLSRFDVRLFLFGYLYLNILPFLGDRWFTDFDETWVGFVSMD